MVWLTCNVSLGNGEQREGKNESRESSENATSVIQVTVDTGLDQEDRWKNNEKCIFC